MDASASPEDFNEVYAFFLKINNSNFPCSKQKNTVIKYTKLPDFDIDSRISWAKQNYMLHPRLRRIISVDNPEVMKSCSLRNEVMASKTSTSNYTKRKIVTISEDDENDGYPNLTRSVRKSSSVKTSNRSVATDVKEEKQNTQRVTSRLTNNTKYVKEPKHNMKSSNVTNRKEVNVTRIHSRSANINQQSTLDTRAKKGKETIWNTKSGYTPSKDSISNKIIMASESEKEISVIKNKIFDNSKMYTSKKSEERTRLHRPQVAQIRKRETLMKDIKNKNKPITLIHVPLDEKYQNQQNDLVHTETSDSILDPIDILQNVDCAITTKLENIGNVKHMNIGTDPPPLYVDQETEIEPIDFKSIKNYVEHSNVQTEVIKEIFDCLQIPNVTLTKDKIDSKDEIVKLHSQSLPNLKVPTLKVTPNKEQNKEKKDPSLYKSSSFIISRATVTCTTRQEIDFHVVEDNDDASSNLSRDQLPYPINVMSVIKKEMSNRETKNISFDEPNKKKDNLDHTIHMNDDSLNCSNVFNRNKLMKPSDIISTIRLGNGLLQSDYVCEQFQRELNFIDSFFESLQYLESCSLSDKGFPENKVHSWVDKAGFDVQSPDYGPFLPRLENGTCVDDSDTMASKSLCLLNLLIRDEQRRAKNLLFVLKMREDALKDFTKSQILWLEDKKKQENIDISTLKKKQRGALLKLQHECGEMQRMRKALLTLTEKRKVALMKTKKNIELKLSNSLNVDQILIGKKKLKKCTLSERITTPLKCFDLSSSGCDDSTTSRPKSDMLVPVSKSLQSNSITRVSSAEKSIQTGDSILGTVLVDRSTDTAAEHFVVVDGGYLNILFHNLALPQIFSSDKQYEVNEEALRNIVNSTNTHRNSLNETGVLEKLMGQIKNPDLESSTPSTARSLVEELDQYYKGLTEADKSSGETSDRDYNCGKACEVKDASVQVLDSQIDQCYSGGYQSVSIMNNDSSETIKNVANVSSCEQPCEYFVNFEVSPVETKVLSQKESGLSVKQTGPLPVPAGAAAGGDLQPTDDVPLWLVSNTSATSFSMDGNSSFNSEPMCGSASSISSLTSPVHCEAEQLRRQQLAIEREIKALEQQQCQLLVVREIPDKPPPPYTPPTELRIPKKPRMFLADDSLEDRVKKYITNPDSGPIDPTDGFDAFVNEFCHECLQRQKAEHSDKPWDACNLLPQKSPVETEKVLEKTSSDLSEILMGVAPTLVSGVSSRRSDHIDDILFAEWRRCEPEWTSLHTDEAIVKNQLFESIFQKILSETIDEYKSTVLCNK